MERRNSALFDVYLRLRPSASIAARFLDVDPADSGEGGCSHVTLRPPEHDFRKRAVEKFAFTKIFEEDATQRDVFDGTEMEQLLHGVLGADGRQQKDGMLATLGVTGSGKSHTILGSRSQRGITQLLLNVLFGSIGKRLVQPPLAENLLGAIDNSEALIISASTYLDSVHGEGEFRATSRAPTPLLVSKPDALASLRVFADKNAMHDKVVASPKTIVPIRSNAVVLRSAANPKLLQETFNHSIYPIPSSSRRHLPNTSSFPKSPNIANVQIPLEEHATYAIVISMYEVYNDRIFDLLSASPAAGRAAGKDTRRRALLYKSTEQSPDRKVVAGLKKIICGSLEDALLVLETGLTERRVAGTGSNAVSSRSHGFFCVEVKKRMSARTSAWSSATLTIVDLAGECSTDSFLTLGSERARTAKTQGSTLAEAGKINESLMYLGQCMQLQASVMSSPESATLVPFRQCKLTELLFSNNIPHNTPATNASSKHNQQKAVMIVTADARGDFNATSQILRYSALAREVTVPRIPSTTSTLIGDATISRIPSQPVANTSAKIAHESRGLPAEALSLQVASLKAELEEERHRRTIAETCWLQAGQRAIDLEQSVREECWAAFEQRLLMERERWAGAWHEERDRVDDHVDRKLDVALRSMSIYEDGEDVDSPSDLIAADREIGMLRARVEELERQVSASRSPSRTLKPFRARPWRIESLDGDADAENVPPY